MIKYLILESICFSEYIYLIVYKIFLTGCWKPTVNMTNCNSAQHFDT